ncbi:hypothetical protein [Salipaludibacillus daqingensis]|uniref:hypothetical protein n=1 Tax=Salipaludibacillus daqingensis TaxID=3041001 RepID=UPI00247570C6|nr:hypothetical protein [Salipaludibacillus daqingensis]
MFIFIWELFIIVLASMALGSMPAHKRRYPFPTSMVFFILIAIIPLTIGIVIGASFFYWISSFIFKIFVFLFAMFIVAYFFRMYHPSYGYVPYHQKGKWFILAGFFFLLGIEFATYGFSAWFVFFVIPLSAASVILGFIFMRKAIYLYRFLAIIHFFPLAIFFFVAILKLI